MSHGVPVFAIIDPDSQAADSLGCIPRSEDSLRAGYAWGVPDAAELEAVPCHVCGSASGGAVWGREAGFVAVRCSECQLVYVTPRPRLTAISEAAKTGQHATETSDLDVTGRYRASRVRGAKRRLRSAFADLRGESKVRWLDIGAGFGELVAAVAALWPDVEVVGVEPNRAKRAEAGRRGIELTGAELSDLETGRFDVVSLMNVWSHLPDPGGFMAERVRPLLRPGGHLLLQTGNGAEISRQEYPDALLLPDHLSFAGERHLRVVLERSGFQVETVWRERADTLSFATAALAKRLLGRPARVIAPYRSSFRMIYLRARRSPVDGRPPTLAG